MSWTAYWVSDLKQVWGSYSYFTQSIREVFEYSAWGQDISEQLLQLRQGTDSAAEYEFQTLAAQSDWKDTACRDQDMSLSLYLTMAIWLDNLICNQHLSWPLRTQSMASGPMSISSPREPMQLGWTQELKNSASCPPVHIFPGNLPQPRATMTWRTWGIAIDLWTTICSKLLPITRIWEYQECQMPKSGSGNKKQQGWHSFLPATSHNHQKASSLTLVLDWWDLRRSATHPGQWGDPLGSPDQKYVPTTVRTCIMHWDYMTKRSGNPGVQCTTKLIQNIVWWLSMTTDVKDYVEFQITTILVAAFSKTCKLVPHKGLSTTMKPAKVLLEPCFS